MEAFDDEEFALPSRGSNDSTRGSDAGPAASGRRRSRWAWSGWSCWRAVSSRRPRARTRQAALAQAQEALRRAEEELSAKEDRLTAATLTADGLLTQVVDLSTRMEDLKSRVTAVDAVARSSDTKLARVVALLRESSDALTLATQEINRNNRAAAAPHMRTAWACLQQANALQDEALAELRRMAGSAA